MNARKHSTIERIRISLLLVALTVLAACAGPPSGPARVTSVSTEPGTGYVTVRWEVTGTAERYDVSRAVVGDEASLETIASIEDGSVRSYDDVTVEPGVSYTYSVAMNGGAPVSDGSDGVRPEPGNRLQVLFGGPVPDGVVVRSEPGGISCASAGAPGCTADFAAILDVTLSVEASPDVTVVWDACDASMGGTCTVTMTDPRTVTLSVAGASRTLDVAVEEPGMGRVTNANDLGTNPVVDCSDSCRYVFPDGLMIGLRADPIAPDDHRFASWAGACAGESGPSCTVTMDESKDVQAFFEVVPPVIASFEADPSRIWSSETATLSWSVSGGGEVRLTIEPDVGDVTGRSEVEVSPDETTSYTLTASNDSGTVTAETRVSVRLWPFGLGGKIRQLPYGAPVLDEAPRVP